VRVLVIGGWRLMTACLGSTGDSTMPPSRDAATMGFVHGPVLTSPRPEQNSPHVSYAAEVTGRLLYDLAADCLYLSNVELAAGPGVAAAAAACGAGEYRVAIFNLGSTVHLVDDGDPR
jgi:hypothetical protein